MKMQRNYNLLSLYIAYFKLLLRQWRGILILKGELEIIRIKKIGFIVVSNFNISICTR